MLAFGEALPALRKRLEQDLARTGMPREKVMALVVTLLESTLIRIGNPRYARDNRSYGLTTLRTRHVDIRGTAIRFHFRGKSGVEHQVTLRDRRLARLLRRCLELPGQQLFQYLDDDGQRHTVGSGDINQYLRDLTGSITAKDYRTRPRLEHRRRPRTRRAGETGRQPAGHAGGTAALYPPGDSAGVCRRRAGGPQAAAAPASG
ncbi:hypothetical protein SSTU70S_03049 [Stutzerimonas stutzeri]